jgi:hypothetical protein
MNVLWLCQRWPIFQRLPCDKRVIASRGLLSDLSFKTNPELQLAYKFRPAPCFTSPQFSFNHTKPTSHLLTMSTYYVLYQNVWYTGRLVAGTKLSLVNGSAICYTADNWVPKVSPRGVPPRWAIDLSFADGSEGQFVVGTGEFRSAYVVLLLFLSDFNHAMLGLTARPCPIPLHEIRAIINEEHESLWNGTIEIMTHLHLY